MKIWYVLIFMASGVPRRYEFTNMYAALYWAETMAMDGVPVEVGQI